MRILGVILLASGQADILKDRARVRLASILLLWKRKTENIDIVLQKLGETFRESFKRTTVYLSCFSFPFLSPFLLS